MIIKWHLKIFSLVGRRKMISCAGRKIFIFNNSELKGKHHITLEDSGMVASMPKFAQG